MPSSLAGAPRRGPLEGIRIIDLTSMLSGPWATMILADQGADVIKVERPDGGDHVRALGNRSGGLSAMFLNLNRSKRSVTIDLKSARGVDLVKRLAAGADVLVQNFRPGVIERLGLGEGEIRKAKPDIVYVSICGFGESGPWVGKPVYDPVIQAVSGLTTVQAGADEHRPRLVRTIVPDKVSALAAAQAITAAIVARARHGVGQHVRLSMLDAVLAFMWASDMESQTFPDRASAQQAASFQDLIYQTKDGYMTVAVMSDKEWQGLTRALGKPEWRDDPRFLTPELRAKHVDERLALVQDVLRTRTTEDWMARLEANDVPCAPALTRTQVLSHPQVIASETLVETMHPHAGRLRQARPPARFDKTPAGIQCGAPLLGEHTDEVLKEVGLSANEIADLRAERVIGPERYEQSAGARVA
jgi:crotonobetainyl-CoA:carnitine CoA-transferase CaiB-like acyl-CoA transferase